MAVTAGVSHTVPKGLRVCARACCHPRDARLSAHCPNKAVCPSFSGVSKATESDSGSQEQQKTI